VVKGRWVYEHDGVLSLDHEVCNVEGSKLHPSVLILHKVTCSIQMVQARGNVNDEMAVDEDLELADAIIEVVQIEALEGQENWSG